MPLMQTVRVIGEHTDNPALANAAVGALGDHAADLFFVSAKQTASTDVACGSGIIDAFGLAELVDASGFGTTA